MLEYKNPIKYEIVDLNNEPILGRFYESRVTAKLVLKENYNVQVFKLRYNRFLKLKKKWFSKIHMQKSIKGDDF